MERNVVGAYVESGSRHFWACPLHLYIDSLRLRLRRRLGFCNIISHKALLPTTHFPAILNPERRKKYIPLIQTSNEIPLRSLRQKTRNPEPARLLVIPRSRIRPHRITQDLLSRAGSL